MKKNSEIEVICLFDENSVSLEDKLIEIFKVYLETKKEIL